MGGGYRCIDHSFWKVFLWVGVPIRVPPPFRWLPGEAWEIPPRKGCSESIPSRSIDQILPADIPADCSRGEPDSPFSKNFSGHACDCMDFGHSGFSRDLHARGLETHIESAQGGNDPLVPCGSLDGTGLFSPSGSCDCYLRPNRAD